MFADLLI